jgi:LemA protein
VRVVPTVAVVAVLAAVLVLGVWTATWSDALARSRDLVREAWREVDAELRMRHELVPDLVRVARPHLAAQRAILDGVLAAAADAALPGSDPADRAAREGRLSAALARFFEVAAASPALRADEDFAALRRELTETEDRVAAGVRFHDGSVRRLNARVGSAPAALVARLFSIRPADYFGDADPVGSPPELPTAGTGTGPPG